ncbi:hypothetical protein L1987_44319 [Smallanthus sonchifolius]|uniref:Uncharacterized protein n=1 Tax=Smallanthus sonchifolius TaxID=185202 RepID=A0ACB9GNZ5_9ASTR|nr:hypothetical protein L1987_44319 [Smallanthus sonchifolius]
MFFAVFSLRPGRILTTELEVEEADEEDCPHRTSIKPFLVDSNFHTHLKKQTTHLSLFNSQQMAFSTDLNCTMTTTEGRLSNFSECSSLSSVSDHEEFARMNSDRGSINRSRSRSQKWKRLMKKLVKESKKSFYGSSKPSVFSYDAVSYSLNFDDGNHRNEYYSYQSRCSSQVL